MFACRYRIKETPGPPAPGKRGHPSDTFGYPDESFPPKRLIHLVWSGLHALVTVPLKLWYERNLKSNKWKKYRMCYMSSFLFIPYGSSILPLSKIQQGAHTICFCSRLLFYSKCTGFTVCFTYSDISLLTLSLLDLMSSSGISVMSSAEWSLVRKCSETVVGLDTGWVVNWSAVFFETVFESSFGFTYVFIWSSGCIASCKWRFLSYSRSDEW